MIEMIPFILIGCASGFALARVYTAHQRIDGLWKAFAKYSKTQRTMIINITDQVKSLEEAEQQK